MKIALAAAALLISASAHAKLVAVAAHPTDGSTFLLTDMVGMCVGDAHVAEYVAKDGNKIGGCWISNGTEIQIAFLDGEVANIPIAKFSKPKEV